MPWDEPFTVHGCGDHVFVSTSEGIYASVDGARWELEVEDEDARFLEWVCSAGGCSR